MRRIGGIAAALALFGAAPLAAQYFGQNKVQYQAFDFRIIQTEHFEVYYYPAERTAALDAARMPSGGTPACRASCTTSSRAEADHLVRLAVRLPADQHTSEDLGEGNGRLHGVLQAPDGIAFHRLRTSDLEPRAVPRDGAPVPV